MSGFNYTSTNLLADIKRRSYAPISQITLTDQDLLDMADEELQVGVVPFMMEVREEYLVDYVDYNIEGNENQFEVPSRSIGAKLRDVTVLTSPSSQGNQPNEKSLPQINAEDSVWNNNYNNLLSIQSFFLRDNNVVLSPSASSYAGQQLRLYYFKRPNKLVLTSNCAQITSITDNTCTVNLVPTSYGSGNAISITSDVVKASPPFKLLTMDISLTIDSTTNTVTFPNPLSDYSISVGDYICLAGETPIPIIPVELQSFLAQRVAVTILSSLGDPKNFEMATNRLLEMEKNIRNLISNRVEGANRKVVNRFSTFNQSPYRRY
jgi:hypothetical protein